MEIDIQAVMGCTCLKLRKASRHITQIYDHALSSSALTVNQFGLLAWLYGARQAGRPGLAIGVLGERLGELVHEPVLLEAQQRRGAHLLAERGRVKVSVEGA